MWLISMIYFLNKIIMHPQERINKIIKEIRQWQQMYDWKFKSWEIFWEMFYKELKSILIKHCSDNDEPSYAKKDFQKMLQDMWIEVYVLDLNELE